jgi:hypothetical protein
MKYYKYKAKIAKLKGGSMVNYSPIMEFDDSKFLDKFPDFRNHYDITYKLEISEQMPEYLRKQIINDINGKLNPPIAIQNNSTITTDQYEIVKNINTFNSFRTNFKLKEITEDIKNEILTAYNNYIIEKEHQTELKKINIINSIQYEDLVIACHDKKKNLYQNYNIINEVSSMFEHNTGLYSSIGPSVEYKLNSNSTLEQKREIYNILYPSTA